MTLKASEIAVGDTFEEVLVEDLKRTQLVMYSGASGDYNPLHTDDVYCREAAGYPGVFAHGMLTMGMTGRVVTNLFGPENIKKYGVRFTNQVWPGDDLSGSAVVEAIRGEGSPRLQDRGADGGQVEGVVVPAGNATGRADP
ncbi:MAG: acyl dehydratase [Alphaproteobacteria bacterium]|nr:acyl dehydratase [Alphaproteobacteria bacterium]